MHTVMIHFDYASVAYAAVVGSGGLEGPTSLAKLSEGLS